MSTIFRGSQGGGKSLAINVEQFQEECGAQLYGDIRLLAVRSHNRFDSGPYLMFYMHATGYTGVIENKEPDKCERWSWYDIRYIDPVTTTEPKDILDLLVWGLKDILERGYCPLCQIFRTTAQGDDRPRRLMAHMAQFQARDVKHAELYERLKTVYTVPRRTKCPPGL